MFDVSVEVSDWVLGMNACFVIDFTCMATISQPLIALTCHGNDTLSFLLRILFKHSVSVDIHYVHAYKWINSHAVQHVGGRMV